MKREELIRSKAYWITQLQIKLFETVKDYLKKHDLTQSEFADEIGVNKSYITQVLNGDFDHKISKYVELLMACNKVPLLETVDIEDQIGDEICGFSQPYASLQNGLKIKKKMGDYRYSFKINPVKQTVVIIKKSELLEIGNLS